MQCCHTDASAIHCIFLYYQEITRNLQLTSEKLYNTKKTMCLASWSHCACSRHLVCNVLFKLPNLLEVNELAEDKSQLIWLIYFTEYVMWSTGYMLQFLPHWDWSERVGRTWELLRKSYREVWGLWGVCYAEVSAAAPGLKPWFPQTWRWYNNHIKCILIS